jgi:hypothetical protein
MSDQHQAVPDRIGQVEEYPPLPPEVLDRIGSIIGPGLRKEMAKLRESTSGTGGRTG